MSGQSVKWDIVAVGGAFAGVLVVAGAFVYETAQVFLESIRTLFDFQYQIVTSTFESGAGDEAGDLPGLLMLLTAPAVVWFIFQTLQVPVGTPAEPITYDGVSTSDDDNEKETYTLLGENGDPVTLPADDLEARRIRTGDSYAWVVDDGGEPVRVEPAGLWFDPAERARERYVNGEIDERELESRLMYDLKNHNSTETDDRAEPELEVNE